MEDAPASGEVARRVRVAWRVVSILLFTVPSGLVQAALLMLPGRAKARFPRFYWGTMCRLVGLRVRVIGAPVRDTGGRSIVFASNHSSWLDILVLGGALQACFIAKSEVGRWPVIRTIARLGRTEFVSRKARDTGRERDSMRGRLGAGDNLILFPEGTSNDGSRVLPFRSAFFSVCEPAEGQAAPLIQPVSVVYDQVGGLPVGRASRVIFAWYGDMDLASHFWRLGQFSGLRATIVVHPPVDPLHYGSRKALSNAVWQTVAGGAATLRQNRPAEPRATEAMPQQAGAAPAFA